MSTMTGIPPKDWQPPFITIETSMGAFVVELYWRHAPNTCRNFAELARRGYYDGVIFHRIIRDFMAQTGDPTGTGRGGASIYGKTFEDEVHDELKHTDLLVGNGCVCAARHGYTYARIEGSQVPLAGFSGAGILSMANSGANTNGSQFFVTLAPTQWLDGKHTIFGRVYTGMKVVQGIGMVQTDNDDRPLDPVKINRAFLTESGTS